MTLLILVFVAVPLRYLADLRVATQVVGPIHGLAFVAYIMLLTEYIFSEDRPRREWIRLLMTALVPFGALLTAYRLRISSRHSLEG